MEGCYLTTLPKEVVRALAGFHAAGGGYFLPRAECSVPDEITSQVFPEISSMQQHLEEIQQQEIAGHGFLRLMKWLRTVLVQDSVLLKRLYPTHPLWSHELFHSAAYEAFAQEAERRLQASTTDDLTNSVRTALPIMSDVVQSGLASVGLRLAAMENIISQTNGDVKRLLASKFTLSFASPDVVETAAETTPVVSVNEMSTYKLSRGLRTVSEVWHEYDRGLPGCPAVRELELLHGATWRKKESERQFFCRRKVFYDAVQFLASREGVPTGTTAEALETRRTRRNMTLDRFMKDIKQRGASAVFDTGN